MNAIIGKIMSRLLLSLIIALRFIRGRNRSSMISLVAIISTISISLGVGVLIVGLSAMNGFERELKNRILVIVPHGEIEGINQPLNDWLSILRRVEKVPGILAAVPYIKLTSLIEKGEKVLAVQIRGINQQKENKLTAFPSFIQSADWVNFKPGKKKIILGQGVANFLNVKEGDYVTVVIPNRDSSMNLLQPKRILLHVAGILALHSQLDHSLALLPLRDAQQYLEIGDGVTGISITVSKIFSVKKLLSDAREAIDADVFTESWINTYGYMYRDIQMIRAIMYLSMGLVIGVASFNIVSTLVMAVQEKTVDIAILRTLGAKDSLIRIIFICYGFLVGLFGSLIGVVVGIITSLHLTSIIKSIEKIIGYSFLSGDIYFIDFLPSQLHCVDVVVVLITSLMISLMASCYPARRASCIDPVRILNSK